MSSVYFFKEKVKKVIPLSCLNCYHFLLAFFGAVIYRFPSAKIKVIGVTGTNGKTTVIEMLGRILEEAGFKVASLSSIRFKIGEKESANKLKMTMPGRFQIQKFLRQAVNSGCQYALLEVTSEGVLQSRHRFIRFAVAVFTNLSPEHIERHGSFEKYREAKGKFFERVKNIHVLNLDNQNVDYFLQFPARKKYTYGHEQGEINNKELKLNLKLPGMFNIDNALAAIAVAFSQGIPVSLAQKVVEGVEGVPGRMEEVISQPFKVIVDYAFTPAALEKVYQTLEGLKEKDKRIIAVLGACGGGRDKWKRPVLGEIASRYSQEIIITNEDPYDEDPKEIIREVSQGTKGQAREILDRREAINQALRLAREGDIVIITGKGAETSLAEAGGKEIPWDEREVVREEFKKINNS